MAIRLPLVFVTAVMYSGAFSQTGKPLNFQFKAEPRGNQVVKAELVTPANDFSQAFTVGLKFSIQPDWYLYWKNPGDAGLPIDVEWSLPAGFTAGPLIHPTPEKFVYDDIVAYGYKSDLLLLTTITPAQEYKHTGTEAIVAQVDWLVCEKSCIPGSASLKMDFVLAPEANRRAAKNLLDYYVDRFPRPLSDLDVSVKEILTTSSGNVIDIGIVLEGKDAPKVSDFYPEPIDDFTIHFKHLRVHKGTLRISLTPYNDTARLSSLKGLLMVNGVGYEATFPLDS